MKPEVLNKIVSDLEDEFTEQLLTAFKSLIVPSTAGEDVATHRPAEIQTALDAGDLQALRRLLGISKDGKSWPRAESAIAECLRDELMPIYDFVRNDTWRDLSEHPDNFPDDETDVSAVLATAVARIVADSLEGIETALRLALVARPRYQWTAQQLIDAIGLTKKQATIYAAGLNAAKRLALLTDKLDNAELRSEVIADELKKLPGLIAGNIRRVLQDFGVNDWSQKAAAAAGARLAETFKSFRAKTIATDTTSTAAQATELGVWKAAQLAGVVATDAKKQWNTQHDERVRHSHEEIEHLNADGVLLDASFSSTLGYPVFAPPAELNCRCFVTLRHG